MSVSYRCRGEAGAVPSATEDPFEDDAGNASFAHFPDSGLSIGRFPDGHDSDDNAADFQSNMSPTPAASNVESDSGEGNGTTPPKEGCKNSEAPEAGEAPSKCSYINGRASLFCGFLVLGILRRRE